MTDVFTKKKRSEIMSKIRGKNTSIEKIFERKLRSKRIKFKKHPSILKRGNPDFLIGKVAVFIDGCFWHKCPIHYRAPKSRKSYWLPKIEQNMKRDKEVSKVLRKIGYKVVRIWEHELRRDMIKSNKKIRIIVGNYREVSRHTTSKKHR